MNTAELDPVFARAVRAELVAAGDRRGQVRRRMLRSRAVVVSAGALLAAGALTGAAVVVATLPGTTHVAVVGDTVSATGTGSGTIELGERPADANVVVVDLSCVSRRGAVSVATVPSADSGGGSVEADCALVEHPAHIDDALPPIPGTTAITVTATPGTTWRAVARYGRADIDPWQVNAKGETYGVPNRNGVPDLTSAQATNGRVGYLYTRELLDPDHVGPIHVYKSDGETVVGDFPPLSGTSTQVPDPPTDER